MTRNGLKPSHRAAINFYISGTHNSDDVWTMERERVGEAVGTSETFVTDTRIRLIIPHTLM